MKKSAFFDFLMSPDSGSAASSFEGFLECKKEDKDYINWNGYLLPNHYSAAEDEYHAIRNNCALFDVSPIRKCYVRGPKAGVFLDNLFTRPVSTAPAMRGIYVIFCNDDGSVKDDAVIYKYADDDYLLMPSDIDHREHYFWLRDQLGISSDDLYIDDCTEQWVGVALQGPLSAAVLHHMGFSGVESLKPFEVKDFPLVDGVVRISRMGFTADLGYECWLKPQYASVFKQKISIARAELAIDIPGYGLSALEACRLEGGFIVAGWDFSTEVDPQPGFERLPSELGLSWLVKLDGEKFIGRDALIASKQQGARYVLRTFKNTNSKKPDDGAALFASIDGEKVSVGSINCSAWSWGLQAMLGNASVFKAYKDIKQAWCEIEGEAVTVNLATGAPINLERRNQVPAAINIK
ncbi:MAG: aminomethyltransferase [Oceanicoccus sp.]|jgi:aminomethyltransferase